MIITALVEKYYVGAEELLLEYGYLVIRRHQIVNKSSRQSPLCPHDSSNNAVESS